MQESIRLAIAADAPHLASFNVAMAWETEKTRLDHSTVEAGALSLIANPANGFYLVAERDGQTVAALMVTFEWSDWRNQVFWWIQSVYVLPTHRRQGCFTRLYREVMSLAQSREDVCGLRLYVEQDNANAQATYESLGMTPTPYTMYEVKLNGELSK